MSELTKILREEGEALQPELVAWRRAFHREPELKMDTPRTEARVVRYLKEIGIDEIRSGIGGHGVAALIHGALPGPCLALRSDMDGLPLTEETGLPYASVNGAMHACGHDFHMAAVLGAAALIFRHRDKLRGTVKLIFQPYEEGDGGAKQMIADGVLEDPKVDAILGFHNGCHLNSPYRAGDVLLTPKPSSANIFAYRAVFRGEGGHVCLSRTRVNPLYAAAAAVTRIKELADAHPDAISAVTVFQGGIRNNIIPEECVIEGSIRSFDRAEHRRLREETAAILTAAAEKQGAALTLEPTIDVMSTENDPALFRRFAAVTEDVYPESGWTLLDPVSFIGEDFARYADLIPGFYFYLCARPEGATYPLHSPKFVLDESVLHKASVLFASFALKWCED